MGNKASLPGANLLRHARHVLTPEDVLCVKFRSTNFREGYDQAEVDALLERVVATLRGYLSPGSVTATSRQDPNWRAVTADEIYNTIFSSTRFRAGYDADEVDDFLDKVVKTLDELSRQPVQDAPWHDDVPAYGYPSDAVPPPPDLVEQLAQYKRMLDTGLITQADYDAAKARALGQ